MGDEGQSGMMRGVSWLRDVTDGAVIGCCAGIVQVVAAQAVGVLVGRRERADVAPRLVQRTAERFGESLSRPLRWLLATVFHFGYAIG